MHEDKVKLIEQQVAAVRAAFAKRTIRRVYFVACGGSLATISLGGWMLGREAALGGNIALVREGDQIAIDIPACKIELLVSDTELEKIRAAWVCPEPKVKTGYLARYAKQVTSAAKGAVLSL